MVYPALLPLMRTPRLPVVDWTDAPADLNGLVRFAEIRKLVSARVPPHFKRSLPQTGGRTHIGPTSLNNEHYYYNFHVGLEEGNGCENFTFKRGPQLLKRQENTVLHNDPPGCFIQWSQQDEFLEQIDVSTFWVTELRPGIRGTRSLKQNTRLKAWGSPETCLSTGFFGSTTRKQNTKTMPLPTRPWVWSSFWQKTTWRLSPIHPIHFTLRHPVPSYERPDERETFCWCQRNDKENAGGLEQHQHWRFPDMFSAVGKTLVQVYRVKRRVVWRRLEL